MATGFVTRYKGKVISAVDQMTDPRLPQGAIGITAHAAGGQANATPLSLGINVVSTVATAGDSVLLPPSFPGRMVAVRNNGTLSMQVFGQGTDTVNGAASGTGSAHAAGTGFIYIAYQQGAWVAI